MNENEKELVEMILNGNTEAFERLVIPYRESILNLAYRITGNVEDAKEICQETFLRAFKYLRKFDTRKSFKNWIFKITMNVAKAYVNESIKGKEILNRTYVNKVIKDNHSPAELKSILMECLDSLSIMERKIFLLRDMEGLSVKETAEILGCSGIAVRVHLSSARKKIKKRFQEKFPQWMGYHEV